MGNSVELSIKIKTWRRATHPTTGLCTERMPVLQGILYRLSQIFSPGKINRTKENKREGRDGHGRLGGRTGMVARLGRRQAASPLPPSSLPLLRPVGSRSHRRQLPYDLPLSWPAPLPYRAAVRYVSLWRVGRPHEGLVHVGADLHLGDGHGEASDR